MMTPPRLREPLNTLVAACKAEPSVLAAWLEGSLARGMADDWSDIDLHLLTADAEEFGHRAPAWFGQHLPTVLADQIPGVSGGFIFVTPDWVHVDLIVHGVAPEPFPSQVLVDKTGRLRDGEPAVEDTAEDPYVPEAPVQMFLYFLGDLVTLAHRGEWLALSQNTARMRDTLLIPLMLAENGVRKTDGAKRLNRYLTDEQIAALESLPAVGSEPDQLLAAQEAIARQYLTRARSLYDRLGRKWPTPLETAVRDLWRRELRINLD